MTKLNNIKLKQAIIEGKNEAYRELIFIISNEGWKITANSIQGYIRQQMAEDYYRYEELSKLELEEQKRLREGD